MNRILVALDVSEDEVWGFIGGMACLVFTIVTPLAGALLTE